MTFTDNSCKQKKNTWCLNSSCYSSHPPSLQDSQQKQFSPSLFSSRKATPSGKKNKNEKKNECIIGVVFCCSKLAGIATSWTLGPYVPFCTRIYALRTAVVACVTAVGRFIHLSSTVLIPGAIFPISLYYFIFADFPMSVIYGYLSKGHVAWCACVYWVCLATWICFVVWISIRRPMRGHARRVVTTPLVMSALLIFSDFISMLESVIILIARRRLRRMCFFLFANHDIFWPLLQLLQL